MRVVFRAVRQERESKDIQCAEIKLPLHVGDMMLHGENPPKSHIVWTNKLSKVAGYISMCKNQLYFWILAMTKTKKGNYGNILYAIRKNKIFRYKFNQGYARLVQWKLVGRNK